jgi:hypothetical protein
MILGLYKNPTAPTDIECVVTAAVDVVVAVLAAVGVVAAVD